MAPPFERHVFVCTNRRPEGAIKPSCGNRGGEEIRNAMKKALAARGLHKRLRANAAGCLDACEEGPAVVVYPEGVWYLGVAPADVEAIVEEHLVGGKPVERLLARKEGGENPLRVLT